MELSELSRSLIKHNILKVSEEGFTYASGKKGPYYLDLRGCCTNVDLFNQTLAAYNKECSKYKAFIGVPTTGVVFAAGLAILNQQPFIMVDKETGECQAHDLNKLENKLNISKFSKNIAFLGVENVGIAYATYFAIKYQRPMAIMRRAAKKHGTGKIVEANLTKWRQQGITDLVIVNDTDNPLTVYEIESLLHKTGMRDQFIVTKLNTILFNTKISNTFKNIQTVIIEDLFTTGGSSIDIYHDIKYKFTTKPHVLALIDRDQGAQANFSEHNIYARSIISIAGVMSHINDIISDNTYLKIIRYIDKHKKNYEQKLLEMNHSLLCVGLDLDADKLPQTSEDSDMPNVPYSQDANGVCQYAYDLINIIVEVGGIRAIKPNLAYYMTPGLLVVLDKIREYAQSLGLLVILDAKIGDIMRTQQQYVKHYGKFDAVTCHGYMGSDSIKPIINANLGCYVLALTSNPSRVEFEMVDIGMCNIYDIMTDNILKWNKLGNVGAVIGGTGNLRNFGDVIEDFLNKQNRLYPLLIPGVGKQGGCADQVVTKIIKTIQDTMNSKWSNDRIRHELNKVLINSSSGICYAKSPKQAMKTLINEIKQTIQQLLHNDPCLETDQPQQSASSA